MSRGQLGIHPGTLQSLAHPDVGCSAVREPAPFYAPVCLAGMTGEYCYAENGVPAGGQRTRAQDESLVTKATDLDEEGSVLVPGMGLE